MHSLHIMLSADRARGNAWIYQSTWIILLQTFPYSCALAQKLHDAGTGLSGSMLSPSTHAPASAQVDKPFRLGVAPKKANFQELGLSGLGQIAKR